MDYYFDLEEAQYEKRKKHEITEETQYNTLLYEAIDILKALKRDLNEIIEEDAMEAYVDCGVYEDTNEIIKHAERIIKKWQSI